MKSKKVCLAGAGAVNLLCAWYLQARGYQLQILDAGPQPGPDPSPQLDQLSPAGRRGATWTGPGVRMFTYAEADNYNRKSEADQENQFVFRNSVSDLGWDVRHSRCGDESWIRAHEILPPARAVEFQQDIQRINQSSAAAWKLLQARNPDLFARTMLRHGIVHLFSDSEHALDQLRRHRAMDSLLETYQPIERVLDVAPGLEAAVRSGAVQGAFKSKGFTLSSRRFLSRLMAKLREGGAQFSWDEAITAIDRGSDEDIRGLRTTHRELTEGHFVLSLGAFGNPILRSTPASGRVCGVVGAWATVPHLGDFSHSMKVARKGHVTADANVTVLDSPEPNEQGRLVVSSGFGFTGQDPANIDAVQLACMSEGIDDTVERFFPEAFAAVGGRDGLARTRSYCLRPWTSCGLGIFERCRTMGGGSLLVTGGNNTGGFSQAPVLAEAVVAAIEGKEHIVHRLYASSRHSA